MSLSRSVAETPLRDWQRMVYEQAIAFYGCEMSRYWWFRQLVDAQGRFQRGRFTGDYRLRNTSLYQVGLLTMVVVELADIPLHEAMAIKFPKKCIRCRLAVCGCTPGSAEKAEKVFAPAAEDLLTRTPLDWQVNLAGMYGEANRKSGIDEVVRHEMEELVELHTALLHGERIDRLEEAADVFAWWLAELNYYRFSATRILYNFICGKILLYRPPSP